MYVVVLFNTYCFVPVSLLFTWAITKGTRPSRCHRISIAKRERKAGETTVKRDIVSTQSAEKNRVDIFYFDGASNVQKAGSLLEVRFPRTVTYHDGEHVVAPRRFRLYDKVCTLTLIRERLALIRERLLRVRQTFLL